MTGQHRDGASLRCSMASEANGAHASRRERAREMARSDTGKAAGMAIAQLGANVVSLVFVVAFARILGDDGYGSLGSLLSLFLILYVPGQALQVAVAREVAARIAKGDPDPGAGVRRWLERLLGLTVVVTVVSILARDALALVAVGLDVTGAFLGSMVGFGFVAVLLAFPLRTEIQQLRKPAPGPHIEHRLRELFARSWAPLVALAFVAVLQNVD